MNKAPIYRQNRNQCQNVIRRAKENSGALQGYRQVWISSGRAFLGKGGEGGFKVCCEIGNRHQGTGLANP
jgi:hypothetical protein